MNLIYTLTAYPPYTGGAQLHQHMLAQHLLSHHHVEVICHWDQNRTDWLLGTTLNAPSGDYHYTIDGISVHRIGLSLADKVRIAPFVPIYYPFMDIALPKIAAQLEKHIQLYATKANLIHNVRIGREGLSYASYQTAHKKDIPFVLTPVHHPRWVGWRYQAYNTLYKMADALIALTNVEKNILISLGVNERQITVTGTAPVLPPNADPQTFMQKYDIKSPFVLFVGQHYLYKGYKQLLHATKLVWQKMPDTEFVFIGPAVKESEQEFLALADRRIHRIGSVDLQTKADALAACTVFCMPSMQESFGIVYLEAWSFGKPVIGCNIPAVAEVIQDGGYLVQQDSQEISEHIIDLLSHPTTAQAMGEAGKKRVATQYNWQRIAELTDQVYATLA